MDVQFRKANLARLLLVNKTTGRTSTPFTPKPPFWGRANTRLEPNSALGARKAGQS